MEIGRNRFSIMSMADFNVVNVIWILQ